MKLELGSGYAPTPGFKHLDMNPHAPDVDVLGPVYPLAWCADASVDEMRAVDVLEHVSYRETATVLTEWRRVMKDGAKLYVQVPDAELCMRWYFTDQDRLRERIPADLPQTADVGLAWRLLGGHDDGQYVRRGDDWRLNAHYALFSKWSLTAALADADFEVVSCETNVHPNLCCWAEA
jgi:predicted SAM-dependent methyltransferase